MTDANSVIFRPAEWLPPGDWTHADARLKGDYLAYVADLARRVKVEQLRRAMGADGERLIRRKQARKDNARGPVLSPHYTNSRTQKWLNATSNKRDETVTVFWKFGWGRILGFHARGEVRGAPVRNVIDYAPAIEREIRKLAADWWRLHSMGRLIRPKHEPSGAPAPPAVAPVVRPARPRPRKVAAPPRPRI